MQRTVHRNPALSPRWRRVLWAGLLTALGVPVLAEDPRDIVFDCPCRAEWTEGRPGEAGELTLTFGVRSFRGTESGELRLARFLPQRGAYHHPRTQSESEAPYVGQVPALATWTRGRRRAGPAPLNHDVVSFTISRCRGHDPTVPRPVAAGFTWAHNPGMKKAAGQQGTGHRATEADTARCAWSRRRYEVLGRGFEDGWRDTPGRLTAADCARANALCEERGEHVVARPSLGRLSAMRRRIEERSPGSH